MTENEAIEIHIAENIHRIEVIEDFMHSNSDADKETCSKNISVLTRINVLLQEIQQYRSIGTIEEAAPVVHSEWKYYRKKCIVVKGADMKIHKVIACALVGHKFEKPSIVNTICRNNWLKECSRCGLYVMHGEIGSVPMTKRGAYKVKKEFEEAFPYAKME